MCRSSRGARLPAANRQLERNPRGNFMQARISPSSVNHYRDEGKLDNLLFSPVSCQYSTVSEGRNTPFDFWGQEAIYSFQDPQHFVNFRQDTIDRFHAARAVFGLKNIHQFIRSKNHEQRTNKQEGREKETGYDLERKEGC